MNKVQVFSLSLAAVLAGPVYAQGCSGGNGGGMDATGNQCNTLEEVATVMTGSAINPSTKIAKMSSVRASVLAAQPAMRLVKTPSQDSAQAAMAVPASGKRQAAAQPSVFAKTAQTAAGSEAFCSASGGMDVNGNQC